MGSVLFDNELERIYPGSIDVCHVVTLYIESCYIVVSGSKIFFLLFSFLMKGKSDATRLLVLVPAHFSFVVCFFE